MASAPEQPEQGKEAVPEGEAKGHAEEDGGHDLSEHILQRSNFPWVTHEDEMMGATENDHLDTTTITEVAFSYGVPENVFDQFLTKEIEEAESCYGLPFTLLLVASYAGMMISHHDAITVHSVESALVQQIEDRARFGYSNELHGHKNLYRVSSAADFFSWMQKGLIPLVFTESQAAWELSEGYNDTLYDNIRKWEEVDDFWNNTLEMPDVLTTTTIPLGSYPSYFGMQSFYNRLIGGIRLVQERSDERFSHLYELDPDPFDGRRTADRERVRWVWQHDNETHIYNVLSEMERENWIDDTTQKVEVALATYNGEHNLITLITINFFFSRAGRIWTRIIPESIFAEQYPYDAALYFFFDITWMVCLGLIVISESREVWQIFRRVGLNHQFVEQYVGFWNCVDWLSVFSGCAIIVLASVGTNKIAWMVSKFGELGEWQPFPGYIEHSANYRRLSMEGMDMLEYMVFYMNRCRVLFAAYPMVIALRLLKAFSAQPRLAIVTRTLFNAGQDLLHFMVVFISIYAAFVVCAMVLFGRHMDSFATPARAIFTTFRCAMGDLDWESMRQIGSVEASVFLIVYICVIVFMMLNIFLAIIMSAYYEVSQDLSGSDTLIAEVGQAWTRWMGQRRGDMVPLMSVAHAVKIHRHNLRVLYDNEQSKFKDMKLEPFLNHDGQLKLITIEFLKTFVMKMRTMQARDLLESAVRYYDSENKSNTQVDQMLLLMTEIKDSLKVFKNELKDGPDSSSDSEADDELPGAPGANKAASASAQRASDTARHLAFKRSLEDDKVELHHARLWIGQEPMMVEKPKALLASGDFYGQDDQDSIDVEALRALEALLESNADAEDEIQRLEDEKVDVFVRTQTALQHIEWLEPELLRVSTDATEAGRKFYGTRQRVATILEERHRLHEEVRKGHKDVKTAVMSRAECFELVHSLSSENAGLRHQIGRCEEHQENAREAKVVSLKTLSKAQDSLEPGLDDARKLSAKTMATKSNFFADMVLCMDSILDLPHVQGVEGIAELVDYVKSMDAKYYAQYEEAAAFLERLGHPIVDDGQSDYTNPNPDADYDDNIEELVDPEYSKMLVDYGSTTVGV